MLTKVDIIRYGGESKMTVYLEVDTDSFDYENMTRQCSVRLCAEGGTPGDVLTSGGSDGTITVFGKTFVLPQNVTLYASGVTIISSLVISGIADSSYPSSTPCSVSLTYSCAHTAMYDYSKSFNVSIGAMHLAPVATPVGGSRNQLGTFLGLSGDILSEGYDIKASIRIGRATYFKYSVQDTDGGFYSNKFWIADAGNTITEFTTTVTLSAVYKGVPLPQTYSFPITFYLGEKDGLPSGTVTTGFVSENEAVSALGIGVKNKSAFSVEVTDMSFYYCHLDECIIKIDGAEYVSQSAVSPIITESGEHSWSVTIRDSRGKSQVYSGSFSVSDYGLPEFKAEVKRTDDQGIEDKNGTFISVTVTPEKQFLFEGANSYSYSFVYKALGGGAVSDTIPLTEGENLLYGASLQNAVMYEVTVKGADSFGSEVEKKYVLVSERVELNIAKNKVAIGKKAQKEWVFQCAWDIESSGDVSFSDSLGEQKSMRGIYEGEMLRYRYASAATESELASALDAVYSGDKAGCCITLINVATEGLSLAAGLNAFLSFCDGTNTYVKNL